MTLAENMAYLEQRQKGAREFAAEMHALSKKDAGILWAAAIGGMTLGAGVFVSGMLFVKFVL